MPCVQDAADWAPPVSGSPGWQAPLEELAQADGAVQQCCDGWKAPLPPPYLEDGCAPMQVEVLVEVALCDKGDRRGLKRNDGLVEGPAGDVEKRVGEAERLPAGGVGVELDLALRVTVAGRASEVEGIPGSRQ